MLTLRPYQGEAIDALNAFLASSPLNPCVVLPTGAGKSFVMAETVRRWKESYPPFRCVVLAHRKELVDQNSKEFLGVDPGADVGVYAAGLRRHEADHSITFAGIDSIYRHAGEFAPFDAIIVDEAHRIPIRGEGKYREFISTAKAVNPKVRVVGFTATPFRLGSGPICHRDHILNEICYEANVADLIQQGYLCRLRSKCGADAPDLSKVKKVGGEYQGRALGEVMRENRLVASAVSDALRHLNAENRTSCVWFCVDVEHCRLVRHVLSMLGEEAPMVTGETDVRERDRIVDEFRNRKWRHILNVNVFTEGFNVKQVDAVVLLRPTLSKGLYAQMVGRGLRLHPDKRDCLVLDYARCIETHGPIDCLEAGRVAIEVCPECREAFSRGIRVCPKCGWEIPKQEVERREAEERERQMHEARAAELAILGSMPQVVEVDDVLVSRHTKTGAPDSLCVTYRSGIRTFREWICLDHPGFAGQKAHRWWAARFGEKSSATATVANALQDMFLAHSIKAVTEALVVRKTGKYYEILSHRLKEPT